MPLYINRFRRVRHTDPQCRAIRASEDGLDQAYAGDAARPPARIVEIPDPTDAAELAAIRDFTSPCLYCVPGARESWASLTVAFEDPNERDPGMDWTYTAVVVRNEPSPSHPGLIQVVGTSAGGREVVIDEAAREPYTIGELVDFGPPDDEDD